MLGGGSGCSLTGGGGGVSSVGGESAQAAVCAPLPEAASSAAAAKTAGFRIARSRRARSLQREPVIGDLHLHLRGGRRLLIGAEENHPARQQDNDDNHDSEDDPIHAQVLELKRFVKPVPAGRDGG
jgi:hypothetical protein